MRLKFSKFSLLSLSLVASIIPLAADDGNQDTSSLVYNERGHHRREEEVSNTAPTSREAETDINDKKASSNSPIVTDIEDDRAENDLMDDDGGRKRPLHEAVGRSDDGNDDGTITRASGDSETDSNRQTASEIVHDDSLSAMPSRLPDELYKLGEGVATSELMDTDGRTDDIAEGPRKASSQEKVNASDEVRNDGIDSVENDGANNQVPSQESSLLTDEKEDQNEEQKTQESVETENNIDATDSHQPSTNTDESTIEESDTTTQPSDLEEDKVDNQPDIAKTEETRQEKAGRDMIVNYASKSSGALILDKSNEFKGTSNLLVDDKDKYAISPCDQEGVKYVIVGLSEDILVKSVRLSSYERFSSLPKVFQILGSQTYPMMTEWEDMGTYEAKPWYKNNGQQVFEMKDPSWARYLKLRFLSHYGDEHYCTVTGLGVHGSTTLQGFHEMQWETRDKELQNEVETAITPEEEEVEVEGNIKQDETSHTDIEEMNDLHESNDEGADIDGTSDTVSTKVGESTTSTEVTPEKSVDPSSSSPRVEHDDVFRKDQDMSGSVLTNEDVKDAPTSEDKSDDDDAVEQDSLLSSGEAELERDEVATKMIDAPSLEEEKDEVVEEDRSDSNDSPSSEEEKNEVIEEQIQASVNAALNTVKSVNTAVVTDAVKVILTTMGLDNINIEESSTNESEATSSNTSEDDSLVKEEGFSDNEESMMESDSTATASLKRDDKESSNVSGENTGNHMNSEASENENGSLLDRDVSVNGNVVVDKKDNVGATSKPDTVIHTPISKAADDPPTRQAELSPKLLKEIKRRSPNAECLEALDLQSLKKVMLKDINNNGNGSSNSTPKNEPIFKKLTDEIKLLEANQRVYDRYVETSTDCFMRVLEDMAKEISVAQEQHEKRLLSMEDQLSQMLEREKETWSYYFAERFTQLMSTIAMYIGYVQAYCLIWFELCMRCVESHLNTCLQDERVQRVILFLSANYSEILSFLAGSLFCYLAVSTYWVMKTLTKPKQQKRLEMVPFDHVTKDDANVTTVTKRKRKKKSRKGKGPPHLIPDVSATCSESVLSLSSASIGY